MDRSAEAVVQRQVEAYNAHDLESFLETYAEDVEASVLPGGRILASGREGMRAVYGRLFSEVPEIRVEIASRIVEGGFVVDLEVVSGVPDGAPGRAVAVYLVEAGLIRRVWFLQAVRDRGDQPPK